ncbi:hypothetical protein AVEN_179477-1 [Araneus ventricosus]|uniref:Uncharacterized protein n=1 Tax=Araneus ventricosus TaxID=182803 RepID=A0A4Y2BFP5_ARAVE|nr:hypothetical protein AVEN_179477-1 [Araneus ventricosus]
MTSEASTYCSATDSKTTTFGRFSSGNGCQAMSHMNASAEFFVRPKEHHPALPKHPGKQLKDRPSQQIVRHCGSCIIAPLKSGSCSNPPFNRGTTRHRKWAQRATPPLDHRVDESLLTYTAASPPGTHGVPPMGEFFVRSLSVKCKHHLSILHFPLF